MGRILVVRGTVHRNLPETGRDLLTYQLQRTHNLFSGKETAAIEISQAGFYTTGVVEADRRLAAPKSLWIMPRQKGRGHD